MQPEMDNNATYCTVITYLTKNTKSNDSVDCRNIFSFNK